MREESEILANINKAVDNYETMELTDTGKQSQSLRMLTSNLFYLEKYRVQASEKWQSKYFNSTGNSSAAKEREADLKVPELYMYRRIMTSAYKVVDSMRSTISIYKKEVK